MDSKKFADNIKDAFNRGHSLFSFVDRSQQGILWLVGKKKNMPTGSCQMKENYKMKIP